MMKRLGYLGHFVLLANLLAVGDLPGADKIRVSGGGMTPLHSLIWVANQEGLFKKYGMDVEYLVMNSGTLGVQTMLSNDSQFLFSTGALAVTANLQGADIAMITGGFNLFAFKLIGRPELRDVQDLRGKKISISQFGSATDFAVQASLEKVRRRPQTGDGDSARRQFQSTCRADERMLRTLRCLPSRSQPWRLRNTK